MWKDNVMRKSVKYRSAVRGGPSHDNGQRALKIWRSSAVWYLTNKKYSSNSSHSCCRGRGNHRWRLWRDHCNTGPLWTTDRFIFTCSWQARAQNAPQFCRLSKKFQHTLLHLTPYNKVRLTGLFPEQPG